jgi:hypothetical protein
VVGVDVGIGKSEGGNDELGMGNAGARGSASGKADADCWEPNIESVRGDVCRALAFFGAFGFVLLVEG